MVSVSCTLSECSMFVNIATQNYSLPPPRSWVPCGFKNAEWFPRCLRWKRPWATFMANLLYLEYLSSSQAHGLSSAQDPVHTQLSPSLPGRNGCLIFFPNFLQSFQCFLNKSSPLLSPTLVFLFYSQHLLSSFSQQEWFMSHRLELKFPWLLKRHTEVNPLIFIFPKGDLVV